MIVSESFGLDKLLKDDSKTIYWRPGSSSTTSEFNKFCSRKFSLSLRFISKLDCLPHAKIKTVAKKKINKFFIFVLWQKLRSRYLEFDDLSKSLSQQFSRSLQDMQQTPPMGLMLLDEKNFC